jgi:flavin-dependent dehydrogenase
MLDEAGVELLVNTLAVKPVLEGRTVTGVEVETLLGRELLTADIIIDTTGSADIVHRAGLATDYGLSEDGAILPTSTSWRIAGVDTDHLDADRAVQ